jgi:hypothetical protein
MKLDPNTEMDRLLRRHARHGEGSSTSSFAQSEDELSASHLDADEMIAFAENALPAATRARYSNHLADCDSCRKLVTELAVSSGVAAKIESQTAPQHLSATPRKTWRNWLGALFAPVALRYAASLVVLLGITFIAFRAFRGGREMTFSPVEQGSANKPVTPDSNVQAPGAPSKSSGKLGSGTPADVPPDGNPQEKKDAYGQETAKDGPVIPAPENAPKSGIAQTPVAGVPAEEPFSVDGAGSKETSQNAQPTVSESKLSAARRAEAGKDKNEADDVASTSTSTGKVDLSSSRSEVEREAMAKSAPPPAKARDQRTNEEQAGARKRAANRPAPAASDSAAGAGLADSAGREDRDKKQLADRRAVGGKQFVRRGNAWVDTAYKSQPTVNVRRGSEQYRALVADEPGLRSISNQFDGEVIVVWGGKAYRIQ